MSNGFGIAVEDLCIGRFRDASGNLPAHLQAAADTINTVSGMCRDTQKKYVDIEPCSLEIRETVRPQQISTKFVPPKVLAKQEEQLERREEERMQRLGALRKVLVKIYLWRRPEQVCKSPSLFVRGNKLLMLHPAAKVRLPQRPTYLPKFQEGIFDDGFFWSAVSMLATNKEAFENIFVTAEHEDIGLMAFRFYKAATATKEPSGWTCVTIDNQIPCSANMEPVIGRSFDPDEMWPVYLEKAYAKFLGSYSLLHTGDTWETIVHLTGGRCRLHNWDVELVSISTTCVAWWMLNEAFKLGIMQSLVYFDKEDGDSGPGIGIRSLRHFGCDEDPLDETFHEWNQTACTPIATHFVTATGPNQGLQLVKLRNNFGKFDWNGDWSNDSAVWTKEMTEALNHNSTDDYTTWMKMDDIVRQYNTILTVTKYKGAPLVFFDTLGIQREGTLPHNAHQYLITIVDPKNERAHLDRKQPGTDKKKPKSARAVVVQLADEPEDDDTQAASKQEQGGNQKPFSFDEMKRKVGQQGGTEEVTGPQFNVQMYISQPRRDIVSSGNPKELEIDFFKVKGRHLQSCTLVDTEFTNYNENGDIVAYQFVGSNRMTLNDEPSESRFELRKSINLAPGHYILATHQQFFKDEVHYLVHFTNKDDEKVPTGFQMDVEYVGTCAKPKIEKRSRLRTLPITPSLRDDPMASRNKHNMI